MSVFKRDDKPKSKFQRGGYDKGLVREWQTTQDQSSNTINSFTAKTRRQEYLSSDDLATYRAAIDSYIDSSNKLRGVAKGLGGNVDDASWESQIASMNSVYDETQKHYSKWKNADAYKKYIERQNEQAEQYKEAQKQREEMLAYDMVAGEAALKDLETKYNEAREIQYAINKRIRTLKGGSGMASIPDEELEKDSELAQLREQLAQYGDVSALHDELMSKKQYHTLAGREQEAASLASVVDNEDFQQNSKYVKAQNSLISSDTVHGISTKKQSAMRLTNVIPPRAMCFPR